jgi:hypothetical protein
MGEVLDALRSGACGPVVLPSVLDGAAAVAERLHQLPSYAIAPVGSPIEGIRQWGAMSGPSPNWPSGPPLDAYDSLNRALWSGLGSLARPLADAIVAALTGLSTRPVEVMVGRSLASARWMPEGCGAPGHRDRYPVGPVYTPLREIGDLESLLVWYVVLRASPRGGELRVFEGVWDDRRPPPPSLDPSVVPVPEGALVVHAAARCWHDVSAPEGGGRLTLGGLCVPRTDGGGWMLCA